MVEALGARPVSNEVREPLGFVSLFFLLQCVAPDFFIVLKEPFLLHRGKIGPFWENSKS